MAGKPRKRAAQERAPQTPKAPKPRVSQARMTGDPVLDWVINAANEQHPSLSAEMREKFLRNELPYEEARAAWRAAHADQNVWSDLDRG